MYHFKGSLTVGQINRFHIEIDHEQLPTDVRAETLAVRIKNTTSALMRPAYLTGPYILYTSVREQSYNHDMALDSGDFKPHFDANVKTNCSRWQMIPVMPASSSKSNTRTFIVEITSQTIFSPSATVYYELTIGQDKHSVRAAVKHGKVLEATIPGLNVSMQDTSTIWNMPDIQRDHPGHHLASQLPLEATNTIEMDASGEFPDHLVVLTHGIHSNLTSDLLFMKEMIEKTASQNGERVICKGFAGNACNTERGVKWLAENVGEWVLRETGWDCHNEHAVRRPNPYKRISFIAHSLGGLVQIYALGYVHDKTHGRIFDHSEGGLRPMHFITLATPWLGISAENPAYVKVALDFGIIGKTGQDLGLTSKPLGQYNVHDPKNGGKAVDSSGSATQIRSRAPLLSLLSRKTSPSHIAIRMFETRTIYANIENDGIVPLRTSSLYFLDWEEFSAQRAKIHEHLQAKRTSVNDKGQAQYADSTDPANSDQPSGMGNTMEADGVSNHHHREQHTLRYHMDKSSIDYSSSDESDHSVSSLPEPVDVTSVQANAGAVTTTSSDVTETDSSDGPATSTLVPASKQDERAKVDAQTADSPSATSKLRSAAHALTFAGMMRRVSGGLRHAQPSSTSDTSSGQTAGADVDSSPHKAIKSAPTKNDAKSPKALASGPSDQMEEASHSHSGLMGLIRPNQSHRKPSKAFTRSQTVPQHSDDEGDHKGSLQEPSRTSFFRALESVLNPPMPALDYITDPSLREPREAVIVHDKFYYPKDIPPLEEVPTPAQKKGHERMHHKARAEDKEQVRLEKIRLEEKIARRWHEDMAWRKVLVKLRPDAHNNIST